MAPRHRARANIFGLAFMGTSASSTGRRRRDITAGRRGGGGKSQRQNDEIGSHVAGDVDIAALLERGSVVDRDLVTGAVDEKLGAVGGEAEGEARATVEFAAADKFAGWDVEGPELATAVARIAGNGDGITSLAIGGKEERGHSARGRSDRSEIECEIGEVDDTYAEYPPVNDPIGSVEDTGDFSGKLVGIVEKIDRHILHAWNLGFGEID